MNQILSHKNICSICGKKPTTGNNKPHSLHRTKRTIKPNIQNHRGQVLCTRCLRTQVKKSA